MELGRVLTQLSSLTSGLEKALVQYLDSMMVELLPTSLLVLPGPGGEQGPGEEILARSGQSAGLGDNPPPALPNQFLTPLLLVINLVVSLQLHRQGGAGNPA